jgi:NADH-quinone oxidoreductase subunit A
VVITAVVSRRAKGGAVAEPLVGTAVWPAVLYATLVVVLAGAILLVSSLLGQRSRSPNRTIPYESGIRPAGPLPRRLSIEFYQVALFFVIFDLEAVFIFAWAVNARALGWTGYAEVAVFVVLLLAGLVYLWKVGALDWGSSARRRAMARGEDAAAVAARGGGAGDAADIIGHKDAGSPPSAGPGGAS